MCEIPANVVLAEEFAKRFDGFSIGSNDLTQLTLGVDRDSARLAQLFDERNAAVRRLIGEVIGSAHAPLPSGPVRSGAERQAGICPLSCPGGHRLHFGDSGQLYRGESQRQQGRVSGP